MSSMNGSGMPHRKQWRNESGNKNLAISEAHRIAIAEHLNRSHMVAGAVCCSRTNCDKVKWEQLEKVFRREGGSAIFPQYSTAFPACREKNGVKKDANGFPENFNGSYCPCVMNRAHLVAYCCTRRDCDDASKIGRNERSPAYGHNKY
ncbi:unnamed protein product [Chrysodeixis includens]|uniref:Uncharacterized protein n=1 Tax=Chrysodeixis includens TaxID=689277 RepID=A0A9P0BKP7_CHRIL|nr:unnamed protein product [Chrysodeixis includens]